MRPFVNGSGKNWGKKTVIKKVSLTCQLKLYCDLIKKLNPKENSCLTLPSLVGRYFGGQCRWAPQFVQNDHEFVNFRTIEEDIIRADAPLLPIPFHCYYIQRAEEETGKSNIRGQQTAKNWTYMVMQRSRESKKNPSCFFKESGARRTQTRHILWHEVQAK